MYFLWIWRPKKKNNNKIKTLNKKNSMQSCWEKSTSLGGVIPYILMQINLFTGFVEVIREKGI